MSKNANNIIIRPVRASELDVLCKMDFEVERELTGKPILKELQKIFRVKLRKFIRNPRTKKCLGAFFRGKMIGFAYGEVKATITKKKEKSYVYLSNIYVLPRFRKKGTASLLVKEFVSWAKLLRLRKLRLSAHPSSVKFWNGLGFTETYREMIREVP